MNLQHALTNPIFNIIQQASEQLHIHSYVVGGFVRDFLLKKPQKKDIDIVTDGSGILLAQKVSSLLGENQSIKIFKNFGTAMIRYQQTEIEFVGARKESYRLNSRKPLVENGTLEDDQNRRDFTINTLSISLNKVDYGTLTDPFNGLNDLEKKIIRTPLDPAITYSDDPLRMMRAIRFATQLAFEIDPKSQYAIKENWKRIEIISKERIMGEFSKILLSPKPSIGLKLLEESLLLNYILPEITALKGIDEVEGNVHKDNFWHTLEVVDNIALHTNNLWLRWAALLHDIGKAPTKRFIPNTGWTFHGHEFKGSKMIPTIFRRLKLNQGSEMRYVQKLVMMSARPIALVDEQVTDSAVRRLLFDAGSELEDLFTLCNADITTKNKKRQLTYKKNFILVQEKIKEVEARDKIRNFKPPITGEIIMKIFNLQPGKEIGIIKNKIKDAILDGKIANDYNQAYELTLKEGEKLGLKRI